MEVQIDSEPSARTPQSTLTRVKPVRDSAHSSLLHFPDELLLHVFEKLGDGELYTLSLVSKQCQRLALPLYLSRHGITIPLRDPIDHLTFSAEQIKTLPGLRLVLFTTRVRSLFFEMTPPGCGVHPTTALTALRQMIVGSRGIEEVVLKFHHWFFFLTFPWTTACIELLEAVAQRCTSLELSDHGILRELVEEAYYEPLIESEAAKWGHRSLYRLGRGLFKVLRVCRASSTHSTEAYTHSEHQSSPYIVKNLVLRTPAVLLPPYIGWALQLLNTSPLTRLDLLDINLSPRASTAIFGALTIPTLQHLCVTACRFDFHAFAKFLSRHNTISAFDIAYQNMQRLRRGTLPRLLSLKSIPSNLNILLASTDAFPELARIRVIIALPPSLNGEFVFSSVERSLAPVATRLLQTNIRIGLDVLPTSGTDNWVNLDDNLRKYPILSRVREIGFGMPNPDIVATSVIPKWLSLFPLLEQIEFLNSPNDLRRKDKIVLLRSIVQECVGIRSVKIDDETRDVASWLGEVE